jgi:hypothetical protein
MTVNSNELQPLERWLQNKANQRVLFPQKDGQDYFDRYWALKKYLEQNYFKLIGSSLSASEGVVFTSHGPDHFEKVIEFAGYLIGLSDSDERDELPLRPYEVYLLLCAILMHDAGNLYGRSGHEKLAFKILADATPNADRFELKTIAQIAEAHGGHTNKGDKDTIGEIASDETAYLSKSFRPKLLAALVRFADEICEDRTRAAKILLEGDALGESSAFHKYADSIQSVSVDIADRSVVISFCFSKDDALVQYRKSGADVFLLDEIIARLGKMNAERIYCNRYYGEVVTIRRIRATIDVVDDNMDVVLRLSVLIHDVGYPTNLPAVEASSDNENFTGATLAHRLSDVGA